MHDSRTRPAHISLTYTTSNTPPRRTSGLPNIRTTKVSVLLNSLLCSLCRLGLLVLEVRCRGGELDRSHERGDDGYTTEWSDRSALTMGIIIENASVAETQLVGSNDVLLRTWLDRIVSKTKLDGGVDLALVVLLSPGDTDNNDFLIEVLAILLCHSEMYHIWWQ
ncbi:hypothetical protein DL98DRAFT_124764 [Cadophora sp. DSE1049]|nr:hypothetical protein DL98DRAFT_124764 [Cadophora sp. DSE1049]